MVETIHVHLVATKHVMRYLKGMIDYGLSYNRIMTSYCMIIQIQIGQEVCHIERALQEGFSVWGQP